MSGNRFHIVDVFAERRYAGNQLAVIEDAASLTDEEMQAIAQEMNYSETTFIEGDAADGAWPVRIFTPNAEVPFAGHPTLGTAAVLRERFDAGDEIVLDLAVGEIPVEVRGTGDDQTYWMTQNPPEFGAELDHERLAQVLGLKEDDLDREWPVQVVSTGLPAIMIPLSNRDALGRAAVDLPAYDALLDDVGVENLFPFCADPREDDHHLAARMFSPGYNVPEDPATGSANGCLAGYLARYRYFGDDKVSVSVEQGYEMGRPSVLHLEAEDGVAVSVRVGGEVEFVAEGSLL
ncbi:epimerase [Halogeometricum borinquense DSM 11551]|uniref:Epimerase n=2 Tax=Halogeometricum borinquense TaxID=60847 RepID=E4NMK6_HALBP|nr:PhzF family phenazine biosynthesis protein [Halogeometricum borinquense]ADQ68504.1 predicted epimerase, PhzC/PhzF [Halogeometricum borinquense DSM 11551]ELY27853.1 epimerase [Halogeometricum borinquense DSM 11551]RYJ14970.1 PhzF family phenazine biosynthesis protein [Halogeometricum borinquense]